MIEVIFYFPLSSITPLGRPIQSCTIQGRHWFQFVQVAGLLGFTNSLQKREMDKIPEEQQRLYYASPPKEGRKRSPLVFIPQDEVKKLMETSPLIDKQPAVQWLETVVFPWLERGEATKQFNLQVRPFRWHSK